MSHGDAYEVVKRNGDGIDRFDIWIALRGEHMDAHTMNRLGVPEAIERVVWGATRDWPATDRVAILRWVTNGVAYLKSTENAL